ncbi:N-acetyl-alpha-D-glucosaminyl L-malate synthase [bioreactor metagenome]|uniref:N-acetyl-alpha-D-glucosaminyl L-malate synthase n=1 Tax=bioreactor metagenome TaxID=1076179 RepID=A0A645FUC9_9ZZZZ
MSAVSHHLQEAMKQHRLGRSKNWYIVNNVVDDEVFAPSGIDAKTERIRCINVSCFEDRSKNLSGLVESIEQLVGEGINIECVLAGVGEDFEKTGQLVKDKGLGNRIFFPGLLDKKEVAAQMQQSHFYVQPSHYENVPVVISEALMCGLPVVATKVGGLDEMIDEQNGYLIEPGNKAALTSALKIMADQFEQFDRDQISHNAVEKYSPEAVRRQFLQLYAGIIK